MSAVEDRLAATLAKHEGHWRLRPLGSYSDRTWRAQCFCGVTFELHTSLVPEPRDWEARAWSAHVAAVIASSDDLAVIAEPDAKNPTPALIEAAYIA